MLLLQQHQILDSIIVVLQLEPIKSESSVSSSTEYTVVSISEDVPFRETAVKKLVTMLSVSMTQNGVTKEHSEEYKDFKIQFFHSSGPEI
jgi:hypothetical protein